MRVFAKSSTPLVVSIFRWALIVPPVFCAACVVETTETPATGAVDPFATESAFCGDLAKRECNTTVVESCYQTDTSDSAQLRVDTSNCVNARESVCLRETSHYNAAGAEACLAARGGILEDGQITTAEMAAAAEACLNAFSRNGTAGSSCTADVDCATATGLRCVSRPGQGEGTCATPTVVKAGGSCKDAAAVCEAGNYCWVDGTTAICRNEGQSGDNCSATEVCGAGYKCSAPEGGTCNEKLANNSDCSADDDCKGGFCIAPLGSNQGSCASKYELHHTSETCAEFK